MAAVELGRDLDVQVEVPPGLLDQSGFRNGPHEITAESDEAANPPVDHALARLDGIEPLIPRRLEAVEVAKFVERDELRLFGNADRSLSLHVGVSAQRRYAG